MQIPGQEIALKPSKRVKEETDSTEYESAKKQNPKRLKRCVLVEALPGGASTLPGHHTVVISFSEPVRKRRIFFFRACEALILTNALGC